MKYPVQKYSVWVQGDKARDVSEEIKKILEDHGFRVEEIKFEGQVN